MASLVTGESINTGRPLQTGLQNLQPAPRHQIGGEALREQERDLDGSFGLSEGTECQKDGNSSSGMMSF